MRTALPILLVVALVFGVTFITQFSVTPPPAGPGSGPSAAEFPPLEFPTARIAYDPTPAAEDTTAVDHASKQFAGFFELGVEGNLVPFHFRTQREETVRVAATGRSCGKCTSARGAVFAPAAWDAYVQAVAVGQPWGFPPIPNVPAAVAWGELYGNLKWHTFDFERLSSVMEVPPAPGTDRPTVGLIELAFKIGAVGEPTPVTASFDVFSADGQRLLPQPYNLGVAFAGRDPFEVIPPVLNVGELAEGTEPKAFEVIAYSAVREQADFPPPTLATIAPDPFLTIGPPLPLTPADLGRVARLASEQARTPIRVRSGYRFKVEVRRDADGKSLDIGKMEKEMFAASSTTQKTYRVAVVGDVTGVVRLETGAKIDFGNYQADYEQKKSVRLVSDRPGLEIELVPEQSGPRWATFTLGPPERAGNRTTWPVTVHIRAKEGRNPPWEGTLFLRTKGPNPTNIRIPVTGHGR